MTTRYTNETTGVLDGTVPPTRGDAAKLGGRVHALIGTLTMASQASGDDIVIGKLPKGAVPLTVELCTDTSTGSATLAIGSKTSTAKYKAAAAFTTTDTPTRFMKGAAFGKVLTAEETIVATIGGAALPSSGNLAFALYYTLPEGG